MNSNLKNPQKYARCLLKTNLRVQKIANRHIFFFVFQIVCVQTDAEILSYAEHDGKRSSDRSPVSGWSPYLSPEPAADLQLDGQTGPASLAAAAELARRPIRAPDAQGRPLHRARAVSGSHDQGWTRVRSRDLRHRRWQRQRRGSSGATGNPKTLFYAYTYIFNPCSWSELTQIFSRILDKNSIVRKPVKTSQQWSFPNLEWCSNSNPGSNLQSLESSEYSM